MTRLVQIQQRDGAILRVREGDTPVVEMHLEDHESIVSAELRPRWQHSHRKTVDWDWTVYVACEWAVVGETERDR
jgi:hypothetical protein